MRKLYAAYGSNLNLSQMRRRCPNATVYGTGYIQDHELQFRGRDGCSFLTIEPKPGERVPVGIWSVDSGDEDALDRYEGYPRLYARKMIRIPVMNKRTGEENTEEVFVYIMREGYPLNPPSRLYLEGCLDGDRAFEFPKAFLLDALRITERRNHER